LFSIHGIPETFTPSNVSKLPNHAMQDQPIGLHGNIRSQRC
jgi:hypothetical protein